MQLKTILLFLRVLPGHGEGYFVDAIIKECLSVMDDTAKEVNDQLIAIPDVGDVTAAKYKDAIRKHFGL